jgi:hypothetical protein
MLLLRSASTYGCLASRKGIVITAAIVAALVGASFLIWLIPQSSPGSILAPPRTDSEIIADVYARHNDLAASVESKFAEWSRKNITSQDMLDQLSNARTETGQIKGQLEAARPSTEWQQSFDLYEKALDAFSKYLDALEEKVRSGNTAGPNTEIENLKDEWQKYVNESVDAVPIGP